MGYGLWVMGYGLWVMGLDSGVRINLWLRVTNLGCRLQDSGFGV